MPIDMTIRGIGAVPRPPEPVARPDIASTGPAVSAHADAAKPNPSLRIDPALGLVVIEFRDTDGRVANSIPTEHQLEAYRSHAATQAHPTPASPKGVAPAKD
ncbi:hypothetical protein [Limobrevibacterium gyesilva]|uniref:Uncharacterized protein n=1 Tax=Limobrevibacterium gyesilva TaxID=2991712 RepID=A0AA42CJ36_9PROT|nr:hypothetical protein [Limobrevibacterium gyesilva]MCW3476510.1 hypothetical protein [Limobrevibacterium gyesilva]